MLACVHMSQRTVLGWKEKGKSRREKEVGGKRWESNGVQLSVGKQCHSPDDIHHNCDGGQKSREETKGNCPQGRKCSKGTQWQVDTESKQVR